MAVSLRVLLNSSGKQNVSLLKHLGGTSWRFLDSAGPYNPNNLLTHTGLTVLSASSSGAHFGPLVWYDGMTKRKWLRYPEWWREAVVICDSKRKTVSRWQIIDWAANQDGGAHVDANLDESYHALSRLAGSGWRTSIPGSDEPVKGVVDASIRQIAHECLSTFHRKLPHIIPADLYPHFGK